jgi:DME family drug/metabolite transporter
MSDINPTNKNILGSASVGTMLILLGGAFLSTGGIIIRFLSVTDSWTVLFYRSIGFVTLLLIVIIFRHRSNTLRAFQATGANGMWLAVTLGCGFMSYVFGMMLTTVANVSFIISAGPLCAAVFGWILLRERVTPITCLVIAGAVVGMGLMFADGLSTGRVIGNLVALLLPLSFGLMVVLIRRAGDIDMLPATCMAGVISCVAGLVFSGSLSVSAFDLMLLLVLGILQLGMGFMLITIGTRYVPAAEAALLSLSESILAPVLAWIILVEIPSPLALIGGVIVLSSVAVQGGLGVYRERRVRML